MATRKPEDFVHLHVHADSSLLDGFGTIPEMVQETLNIGQKALAVTDHGNMHGIYDLYTHATNAGIKPIAGIEAYMAPSTVNRKHKSATYFTAEGGRGDVSGRGAYTHITLLAENNTGLHNLYKMGLLSYTEGFFQKNRIDLELLAEHGEGIIATTGCPSGEIQTRLRLGQKQEAYTFAGKLQDALGKNNVFVELMDHAMTSDLERGVRNELLEMAQKLNMPLVATNDVHYTTQQQAHSHEEFLCVQTRSVMSTPPDHKGGTRFAFEGNSYYLKTAQEMADIFPDHPEALNNTLLIAERSNIIIEPDPNLRPKLDIPDGLDENQHIHREAIQGLQRRLPEKSQNEKYLNRLEKELSILKMKDYVGYFLVVSDFVRWAKNNQIPTGYGRGSAGGSLVAYCLDITDIDPLKYDLLFERFINPERDSPPDIDMDFNDTDREKVIQYVKQKYGDNKVAQIATFGKIGAKAAIKDSIRIKELPYTTGETLSKALPDPISGKAITLKEVYNPEADRYPEAGEFRDLVKKIDAEKVIETAKNFEGRTRSTGVHAAALVISSKPVVDSVPMMQRQNDGAMITQWDYPTCEHLGLLKVDFLGLRNLGVVGKTLKHVQKTRGENINLETIISSDMDNPKTYQLLAKGDSNGVFQLDSCLSGDTLVSGRKIKELYTNYKKGEGIQTTYSIDLSTGKRVRNKILRFVESGIKPVYRLVSESGRMVEATEDHKFMTDSGWKRLGDIDINVDKVLVDQTVKTLMYRECFDCGIKLNSEQRNNSDRCYKCSATHHSNPSKKISREAIAAARQKFYAEGGEPWNKGLTKETSPSLAVVAEKVREKLNGRNIHQERMTEEEYKIYLEQLSIRMSGKNNPMYGKTARISKKGYREDLGHYVRSTWEADYARVLNFLEEPYKYEYKTFELTRDDGSHITYTPDFYLPNQNKYVEIKGFMRHIDAEKIELVQEQHGIKLEVIQQSEFAELQMTYKDLLNWECPRAPETTEWETIKSINFVSEQMTYDISMKAPLNNFLANGFMVHNSGMQSLMKQLKPTDFNDVSALIALYRPGPMGIGAHVDYALRKNGEQESTPIHPELKDALGEILGDTHQIIVYQEQIMLIAQKVANYTLAQADNLRRAMGKKKKSVLDAEYVPFSEGMRKNGYSEEAIKDLWNVLVPFADYGFNKCVSDKTIIRMADGSARSIREVYNMFNRGEEVYVQSMWADGEVKPHRVANVVSTGMKEVYRLETKNGRTVDLTPEHRLLTTRGYLELQNIVVGEDELIVADKVDGGESVTGLRFSGDRSGFVSSYGSDKTRMAEFLIENSIDFEMHKPVGKGECDFYFEGLHWEMDGMDRHVSYFENKYGDIPFVVVTPEDYQEHIADVLNLEHVRNGDVVVSVEKINRKLPTIDIEMAEDGPKNFLTWKGIVSHNSHSVGYGMLSYLTAYLKANYPAEFMSSLLSSVSDDTDKTALYLNDCRSMGTTVDPPNINESNIDYEPASADHIHFGFKAIRGVGEGVAAEIVAARGDVPFKDFNDFVARVPKGVANKRILEALALGGAFDVLGVSRRSVVEFVPDLLKDLTKIHRKAAKSDDVSLFDLANEFNVLVPDVGEWGKLEKLKKERHALGLYVSGHPLEGLDMATAGGVKVSDLMGGVIPPMQGWIPRDAKPLKLAGIVTSLSKKRTKKGETFALGTVEDLTGTIPFVMFPKAFKDFGEFLELDGVYQLSGFHRERDIDGISFTVDALRPLEFSETGKLSFRVKLTEKQYAAAKHVLLEKLAKHEATGAGSTNVIVSLKSDAGDVWEEVLDITVKASPVLSQEVREVFGMLSIGRWRKS